MGLPHIRDQAACSPKDALCFGSSFLSKQGHRRFQCCQHNLKDTDVGYSLKQEPLTPRAPPVMFQPTEKPD